MKDTLNILTCLISSFTKITRVIRKDFHHRLTVRILRLDIYDFFLRSAVKLIK